MSFKPLSDRVLVRPDAPLKVSRGGIIIPDSAQKKPTEGVVAFVLHPLDLLGWVHARRLHLRRDDGVERVADAEAGELVPRRRADDALPPTGHRPGYSRVRQPRL